MAKKKNKKNNKIIYIGLFSLVVLILVVCISTLISNGRKFDVSKLLVDNNYDVVYVVGNIPKINMSSVDVDKINSEINDYYSLNDNGDRIDYEYNVSVDTLSVLLTRYIIVENKEYIEYKSYVIDLNNLKLLDQDEILNKYDITSSDLSFFMNNKFLNFYADLLDKGYLDGNKCDYDCFIVNCNFQDINEDNTLYIKNNHLYLYKFFNIYTDYNYNEYNDCRDIFSTASNIAESECSDILYFFRQEDILKADIFSMSDGISFIKTSIGDDDSSKYNKKIVMGISERFFDLETFNNNSIRYLTQEIQKIFPIFICMLLLTLIVIISIDTIATYKELRNYAVIYICGMSWNRIILINMIYVLLQMLFSLILAVLLCTICDLFNLLSNVIFNFSLLQIIVCTGIIIVSTLSSLILPIGIIRRNTPKQILTK